MINNITSGDIHSKSKNNINPNIHLKHSQTQIRVEKILSITHEEKITHAQGKWDHFTHEEKSIILRKFESFQNSFDIFMSGAKTKNMPEKDRLKFHQILHEKIHDWNLSEQETKNFGNILIQALTSETDQQYQNIMNTIRAFFIIETIFTIEQ